MRLALTGCSWCYLTTGSCSNSSVLLCDNGFVFKQLCSAPQGGQRPRCKLSRLKRAGEPYEIGSDWMLLVLCDNGFVFKQLCSAPQGGHRTPEMQTEQAQKSRRAALGAMTMGSCCSAPEGGHRTPEM